LEGGRKLGVTKRLQPGDQRQVGGGELRPLCDHAWKRLIFLGFWRCKIAINLIILIKNIDEFIYA
jgi:hypothetical protein